MGGADKINTTTVKNSDLLYKRKYRHKKRKNLRFQFSTLYCFLGNKLSLSLFC